jgi:hypothetical protein
VIRCLDRASSLALPFRQGSVTCCQATQDDALSASYTCTSVTVTVVNYATAMLVSRCHHPGQRQDEPCPLLLSLRRRSKIPEAKRRGGKGWGWGFALPLPHLHRTSMPPLSSVICLPKETPVIHLTTRLRGHLIMTCDLRRATGNSISNPAPLSPPA